MGRLFWKTFFGLWLTLLSTSLVVGGLVWMHNQERFEERFEELESKRRREHGDFGVYFLAEALEEGGRSALDNVVERHKNSRHKEPPVYIVNNDGIDLLGKKVPPRRLEKARAAVGNTQVPEHKSPTQQVTTPSGETLLLFEVHRNGHPNRHNRNYIRSLPWGTLLIVILGSLSFSAGLAWYITLPIRHLREATNRFSEGKLDTRVMHKMGKRKDEITDLAKDFDHMAEQVQQLVANQKRLLNDVSHELRSPLARLQVAIEMSRQQPKKTEELMQRVEKESQRLDELVGELLTLSQIEADVYNNESDYFEISGLVASIVDDAEFEATSQQKQVDFNQQDEVLINGSIELLRRAIENVVRNAIYHTAEQTQVIVTLVKEGGVAVVTICDKGKGVSEENLADLFQPFVRINDRNQNVKIPGYGLGLAIARRAVEVHQGDIRAYNRPNGGLCIEMRLPV
ncbi:MAG: HAMP domain-containing protein [Pseudomonadales bacterium]|nr:HAMP domain-containing protein [Pseudomonadales bacterium]